MTDSDSTPGWLAVDDACITDTCRRFDPTTREWVYVVACVRTDDHDCTDEPRELLREPQQGPT